jgi:hypothetical protein
MSITSPLLGVPLAPYYLAYDTDNPDAPIPEYGNGGADTNSGADDCVMAARAHHTIRLVYGTAAALQPAAISDTEVLNEYHNEASQQGTNGLDLGTSLTLWKYPGWTAAGMQDRKILEPYGPYGVALAGSPNATSNDMDEDQVRNAIYLYTGAQVALRLPESINPSLSSTFGGETLWTDTGEPPFLPHAMLLIGYDDNGPIGITWGQRQHMTWAFLSRYCSGLFDGTGLFVVERGPDT